MEIKSLLEQSQDVEKIARDYATSPLGFSGRDSFNEKEYIDFSAGYNSRDAEVEKLKRVILVMEDALVAYEKYPSPSDQVCCGISQVSEAGLSCCNEPVTSATIALTKAREILGGRE